MDALVHLKKKTKAGGRGGATIGNSVLETSPWGMFYADDAGVVSQSREKQRKMMGVIVVVCSAFGITVSEAKTAIMCYSGGRQDNAVRLRHVEPARVPLRNATPSPS